MVSGRFIKMKKKNLPNGIDVDKLIFPKQLERKCLEKSLKFFFIYSVCFFVGSFFRLFIHLSISSICHDDEAKMWVLAIKKERNHSLFCFLFFEYNLAKALTP